jgi:hypothetical protein
MTARTLPVEGIGVAGAPAGGVLSIQGVVGGTALPVSFSGTARDDTDAQAAVATGLSTFVIRQYVLNTAGTWDRRRSMPTADSQAVTGIAGTGIMLRSVTTGLYDRMQDGAFGEPGASFAGILVVTPVVTNTSNGNIWKQRSPNADAVAQDGIVMNSTMLFNGATFDRRRSGGVTGMAGVSGDTANDAVDAGNPVKIGGAAINGELALAAAVSADGDRVNARLDRFGAVYIRHLREAIYYATYRVVARPYFSANVFAAAGRKQFATLFHGAASTKLVRIRYVQIFLRNTTAASDTTLDLVWLTAAVTPITGNPAITPTPFRQNLAAAEATALNLPGTGGTEGALINGYETNQGITGAAPVTQPPAVNIGNVLWPAFTGPGDAPPELILRAGVAEGIAVVVDVSAATTINVSSVIIAFSEE